MPNVKKEEKKTMLLLPTVIWCHPEPFSPLSLSIWSLSLLCICRVGSRRLPRRSWSQWPVSNLKADSQKNTDNISCIVLINGGLTDCIPDIFQKLSATQDQIVWVIESGAHRVSDKLWRGYLWLCAVCCHCFGMSGLNQRESAWDTQRILDGNLQAVVTKV